MNAFHKFTGSSAGSWTPT